MTYKVIPITGEPRSGTSMTMRLLKALGVPIVGLKWPWEAREFDPDINPRDRERIEKRWERRKELNPNGFWELPGTVIRGLREPPEEMAGHAVKIVSSGMYPRSRGGTIFGTSPSCYDRAILCLRNPRSVAKSQVNVEKSVEEANGPDGWGSARLIVQPGPFIARTGRFLMWLSDQPSDVQDRYYVSDFDDLVSDPDPHIKHICDHLGIDVTPTDVVDPDLSRSHIPEWPDQVKGRGELADRLYQHARNRRVAVANSSGSDLTNVTVKFQPDAQQ